MALVVVGFVFFTVPLPKVLRALSQGDWLAALPIAIALPFVLVFLLAFADTLILRGTSRVRTRYFDVLSARAASALFSVVHQGASAGVYAMWLANRQGGRASKGLSAVSLFVLADVTAVCLVSGAAALASVEPGNLIWITPVVIAAALAIAKAVPDLSSGAFAASTLARCANIVVISTFAWMGINAFGIATPFTTMMVTMPMVLVAGALPFNIAGLGAAQLVWLTLADQSGAETILAFHLVWLVGEKLGVLFRGLPFVRRIGEQALARTN